MMKKLVLLMMSVALLTSGLKAQVAPSPLAEGMKLLNYEKNKSALDFFKSALDKNPNDPRKSRMGSGEGVDGKNLSSKIS